MFPSGILNPDGVMLSKTQGQLKIIHVRIREFRCGKSVENLAAAIG